MINTNNKTEILHLIDQSFFHLSGHLLPSPKEEAGTERLEWLNDHAPYALLAQNNKEIPHFIYTNKFAVSCFKYTEEEMLSTPSYLSASSEGQMERNKILEQVQLNHIAFDYSGIRLTKFNEPFTIHDGIIWKIFEHGDHGELIGQAALFWLNEQQKPDWWKILKL